MRVALTGASGFVGRHVLSALVAAGADVTALTHRNPLTTTAGTAQRTLDLDLLPERILESMGVPDVLVHLAWGGLPNYRSDHHVQVELPRQVRFLRACIEGGLSRLVVAGTCLEYGMAPGERSESDQTAPVTTYADAKVRLHRELQALQGRHDFGLTWLRLFYLYGPGQAPSSLYSQLGAAVASGAPRFGMSPGDQVRDFMPVKQAANRIASIALRHPDAGIVNVCSGIPVSVENRVRAWLREWNAEITLDRGVHCYPDYEPHAFWGSTKKLDSLAGGR